MRFAAGALAGFLLAQVVPIHGNLIGSCVVMRIENVKDSPDSEEYTGTMIFKVAGVAKDGYYLSTEESGHWSSPALSSNLPLNIKKGDVEKWDKVVCPEAASSAP